MPRLAIEPSGPSLFLAPHRGRAACVLAAVILVHAGLLAWALSASERTVVRRLETRAIAVRILSAAPPPVAAPPAVIQPVPPQPTVPAVRTKPPVHTRPATRTALPAPIARPQSAATAPAAASTSALSPPAAPAAATPALSASSSTTAPAIERPTLALSVPKSVAHVDCNVAKPDYPELSKRRGENGTAIVSFVVGLSGRIENVRLQQSSGYPRLDEAALDAIHASACQPYKENGDAIRAAYSQPFVFGLTD
jgi:protein TonB